VIGTVNFPPYEAGDDGELAAQHRKFQIFPAGEIYSKGARHIPYNSEKKDFMVKTGREAFEGTYVFSEESDVLTESQCSSTPSKSLETSANMPSFGTTTLV